MKDEFNESLPYITHFVVLDPYLKIPQILLIFIRHLILIKSNLSKKKSSLLFRIKFKQFHTFTTCSKLKCVIIIILCNNFEHFLCVVTVVNCLLFLLTSSSDVCIVYFVLYPLLILHV